MSLCITAHPLGTSFTNIFSTSFLKRRCDRALRAGKAEGAKCLLGGNRRGAKGYYVEPTVFSDVTGAPFRKTSSWPRSWANFSFV